MSADKVVRFRPQVYSSGREPALTDQELIRIRAMLQDFEKIKSVCPIAHQVAMRPHPKGRAS